ncbi:MAG: DUF4129 domain-containing protein [Actinomycetia bacterium]|nr:DUF4129 domain-containing protein [Actinomycetes bacterium]
MRAFARLIILFVSGSDPLEPIDQDPDAVREEACRLVSRDQAVCAPPDTTPPPRGSGSSGVNVDWLGTLLWIVLIAAVLVAMVYLARYLMQRSGRGRAKKKRETAEDGELDEVEQAAVAIDRSREPTNWRAEADEHRRAGRYREAMRCRYRALVGDLARRGLIDEIPGRTTGEERTQLRRVQPDASSPFTSAADLFDDAWFGHHAVDAADDDRFQSFERDVLAKSPVRK